jgi:putative hemolysin
LSKSSNLILKPFGDKTTFIEARHSAEELQQLVEEATESGTLHPQAGEIASRALEFPELSAADVMVPRPSVVMLRRHSSVEEVRRVLLEHSHTRMPVYDGTPDNVVGYVHVKDLLAFAWENKLIVLEDVMRPAVFVPESQRAIDLLQDMRRRRNPFAVVIDEQGGMSGIVTMEDLLEELVGDIFSEHARPAPEMITREADDSVLIQGDAPIREVNRELSIALPEGEWTTVAGLCMALAGHMLAPGEKVTTPDAIVLEVVDATTRRIRTVRLRLPAKQSSERD